jgi:hypothetical protein
LPYVEQQVAAWPTVVDALPWPAIAYEREVLIEQTAVSTPDAPDEIAHVKFAVLPPTPIQLLNEQAVPPNVA